MAVVVGIERARSDHASPGNRYRKVHAAGSVQADVLPHQFALTHDFLERKSNEFAFALTRAIRREVRLSPSSPAVPFEMVVAECAAHIRAFSKTSSSGADLDTGPATAAGSRWARYGLPLSALLDAHMRSPSNDSGKAWSGNQRHQCM